VGVSLVPPEKRPRTKDDDDEEDRDMMLNRYGVLTPGIVNLRGEMASGAGLKFG
jgi:hypothetical protein